MMRRVERLEKATPRSGAPVMTVYEVSDEQAAETFQVMHDVGLIPGPDAGADAVIAALEKMLKAR